MKNKKIQIDIEGHPIHLCPPEAKIENHFHNEYAIHALRASLRLNQSGFSDLVPAISGYSGSGKTSLAIHFCQNELKSDIYTLQCTSDIQEEDLSVVPVFAEKGKLLLRASPLVSAMLTGQVCLLDDAHLLSERAWASLMPLLDHRNYLLSQYLGLQIYAKKGFRLLATINTSARHFLLPEPINQRLVPKIQLKLPSGDSLKEAIRFKLNEEEEEILNIILSKTEKSAAKYTLRDFLNMTRLAMHLKAEMNLPGDEAAEESLKLISRDNVKLDIDRMEIDP